MNRLHCQKFYDELNVFFESFSSVALLTIDKEIIYVKYESLADLSTLPHCAEVSDSYLHLQDGDIVLTNDPYSGGSLLSCPTLILGVGTRTVKSQVPAEFLIACRIQFVPKVGIFKTIDDEGLRIPPSPYYIKGQPNKAIIEALRGHPLTPPGFTDRVLAACEELLFLRSKLKGALSRGTLDLSKANIKNYLNSTSELFERRIDDIAEGSRTLELAWTDTENLRMRIDHTDGHFHFDFTGTTPGEKIFLTDTVTFSTVVAATISFLGREIPVNSGVFSRFDVKTPRGCFLNATFPRSLYLGHTDGTLLLAQAIVRCLSAICTKQAVAGSGSSYCAYQLEFQNNKFFYDSLSTGTGANANQPGLDGFRLWSLFDGGRIGDDRSMTPQSLSIERAEREFPIQFLGAGYRLESGGRGHHSGGQGEVRRFKVLEDAQLSFHWGIASHGPEGVAGGKSGSNTEVIVDRAQGEKLIPVSPMSLKKGDVVTILSAGGGGYGES